MIKRSKVQELTPFSKAVIQLVLKIPSGKVATYGQIAKLTGRPNASRGVVWILSSSSKAHQLPWHRVLNSKGQIAFPALSKNFREQKRLLIQEGVEVTDKGLIDLKIYQWPKKLGMRPRKTSGKPNQKPQMFG